MKAKDVQAIAMHNITVLVEARKLLNKNLIKHYDDQTHGCYEELDLELQNAIRAEANRIVISE